MVVFSRSPASLRINFFLSFLFFSYLVSCVCKVDLLNFCCSFIVFVKMANYNSDCSEDSELEVMCNDPKPVNLKRRDNDSGSDKITGFSPKCARTKNFSIDNILGLESKNGDSKRISFKDSIQSGCFVRPTPISPAALCGTCKYIFQEHFKARIYRSRGKQNSHVL